MGIYSAQRRHISAPPRRLCARRRSATRKIPDFGFQFPYHFARKVHHAGKMTEFGYLLFDSGLYGLNRDIITRAEFICHGHRDLLVAFNKILPADFQCTVPAAEENPK